MSEYVIEYERSKCIGAQGCVAADPKNWVLAKDGKANVLKKAIKNDAELSAAKAAEAACPVNVIHVKLKEAASKKKK